MKKYLVTTSVECTRQFIVEAESASDAEDRWYNGEGELIEDSVDIEPFGETVEEVDEYDNED